MMQITKWVVLGFLLLLSACAPHSAGLLESVAYCDKGLCSQVPVLVMVTNKKTAASTQNSENDRVGRGFIFTGWVKYDGRIKTYGPKYLAFLDRKGGAVCRGQYLWTGFGRANDARLICFSPRLSVAGKLRTIGRQSAGEYRGKGVGTGLLSFNDGTVAVIYGFNLYEAEANDFRQLWTRYGGREAELPAVLPRSREKVPLLQRPGA